MNFQIGDRIELLEMLNDPNPIPHGSTGTILSITELPSFNETQIAVKWDNGRSLMVILPHDKIRKI